MKKLQNIILAGAMLCTSLSFAGEKKSTPPATTQMKTVDSQQLDSNASNSNLKMQIPSNDKENEIRRQAFLEELRKLYKANFL